MKFFIDTANIDEIKKTCDSRRLRKCGKPCLPNELCATRLSTVSGIPLTTLYNYVKTKEFKTYFLVRKTKNRVLISLKEVKDEDSKEMP
jgi:predicted transcriptional regulator